MLLWIAHSDLMLRCGSITRNDIVYCGSSTPSLCCVVDRSFGMIYGVVDRSRRFSDILYNIIYIYMYIYMYDPHLMLCPC